MDRECWYEEWKHVPEHSHAQSGIVSWRNCWKKSRKIFINSEKWKHLLFYLNDYLKDIFGWCTFWLFELLDVFEMMGIYQISSSSSASWCWCLCCSLLNCSKWICFRATVVFTCEEMCPFWWLWNLYFPAKLRNKFCHCKKASDYLPIRLTNNFGSVEL